MGLDHAPLSQNWGTPRWGGGGNGTPQIETTHPKARSRHPRVGSGTPVQNWGTPGDTGAPQGGIRGTPGWDRGTPSRRSVTPSRLLAQPRRRSRRRQGGGQFLWQPSHPPPRQRRTKPRLSSGPAEQGSHSAPLGARGVPGGAPDIGLLGPFVPVSASRGRTPTKPLGTRGTSGPNGSKTHPFWLRKWAAVWQRPKTG